MSLFYTSTAHKTRKSASCDSNIRLVMSSTTSSYPHFSWHIFEHGSDNLTQTFSSDTPDIFLTILSDTFFLTFLQTYLLTLYLIYLVTSCNYFFDHSFWGPARHTELRAMPVAIGVQHATLNWEDPSCHCGPARHTEHRGSQLIEENDEGEEGEEEEEGGEETDIKSNNPHLTGGEKRVSWIRPPYPVILELQLALDSRSFHQAEKIGVDWAIIRFRKPGKPWRYHIWSMVHVFCRCKYVYFIRYSMWHVR